MFYLLVYLIVYGSTLIIKYYLKTSYILLDLAATIGIIFTGIFLVTILILKLNDEKLLPSIFGIRRDNLRNSFLLATALSTPIPLFWLIGIQIVGIDTLLVAAKPSWVNFPISLGILIFAVLFWGLVGTVAFAFWQAFPYELVRDISPRFAVLWIAILWSGLYNTPLLTGKLDPVDILFFGFLFTWVYHKTRNSVGIVLAYLLNENPLWWVIAAVFGANSGIAFVVLLIFRLLVCLVSTGLLIRETIYKTSSDSL
ncbi:hypothetical protein K1720_06600 [Thermococcus argininiproducens]|uniref:Uncharacterized protein n=1 Tax=Thermococcus argininiproducens TaxID=2866384 RepID=A0A9E7M9N7_9EURY|nr:hypothetical protein [Thermococcus argininiproducens]USG99212.1 hypothetical protein K1720_06600 [Thermococcus argininiproducens]